MRAITWNFERHGPHTWQARTLLDRIACLDPEIVCLTEAHEGSCAGLGGFEISAVGVVWSHQKESERKVVLWSRTPWTIERLPNPRIEEIGACLCAVTETTLGPLRIIGLCVPYHMAAPLGASPPPRPWSQQIAFLEALAEVVPSCDGAPMIVLGDFNQFLPRIWGSKAAHEALLRALTGLHVVTSGPLPAVNRPSIDHVACSVGLTCIEVAGLNERAENGRKLSDHFGVMVDLVLSNRGEQVGPSQPHR